MTTHHQGETLTRLDEAILQAVRNGATTQNDIAALVCNGPDSEAMFAGLVMRRVRDMLTGRLVFTLEEGIRLPEPTGAP